jgi:hypothetical protein
MTDELRRVLRALVHLERFYPTHYWSAWELTKHVDGLTYDQVEHAADALAELRRLEVIVVENKKAYKPVPKGGHRR